MAINQQKPDYILIAGLPRSGSTLMQSVLSNNANTYSLPETHFFEEANKISSAGVFDRRQVIELLELLEEKWQLPLSGLTAQYRQNHERQHDIRDVYFQVIETFRPDDPDRSLVAIEKTPGNIIAIESLVTHKHAVKAILTCRNPVDFANSMIQQYWAPASVNKISRMWNDVMRIISSLQNNYPDSIMRIEYERMLKQPDKTFSSVCEFAGLKWNKQMLSGLNANINQFIVPKERDWKLNNLDYPTVVTPANRNCLNIRQRLIIHRRSLFLAFKHGYFSLYKF